MILLWSCIIILKKLDAENKETAFFIINFFLPWKQTKHLQTDILHEHIVKSSKQILSNGIQHYSKRILTS